MTTALLVDHCAVGISGAWRQACRPYCPSISHGECDRSLDNGVGGLGECQHWFTSIARSRNLQSLGGTVSEFLRGQKKSICC